MSNQRDKRTVCPPLQNKTGHWCRIAFAVVRQSVQQVGFVADDADFLVMDFDAVCECADVVAAIAVSGAQFAAGGVGEATDHLRGELASVSAGLQRGSRFSR